MRRAAVGVVVVLLVIVAVVLAVRWSSRLDSRLAAAVDRAPAAQRLSWTDWAAVRTRLGVELDAGSSGAEVEDLLERAFDAGWGSTTILGSSAAVLQERFGLSPAILEWELYAQSTEGAVELLGVPEDTSFDDLAQRLRDLGFTAPGDGPLDGAVWSAGPDVLASIDPRLTPELQYVALLADDGVVLTSDRPDYLEDAVQIARDGTERSPDVAAVVDRSAEAVSAAVYDGAYACESLAMAGADPAEEAEADRLLAGAGEVDAVRAFAMAALPGGDVRVSMAFTDDAEARRNADSRARLAAGPAPGQGGSFGERFEVEDVVADDAVVEMLLAPREGQRLIADLASGPVLFATC